MYYIMILLVIISFVMYIIQLFSSLLFARCMLIVREVEKVSADVRLKVL